MTSHHRITDAGMVQLISECIPGTQVLPFTPVSVSVVVTSESSTLESSPLPQAANDVAAAININDDKQSARIFLFLRFL